MYSTADCSVSHFPDGSKVKDSVYEMLSSRVVVTLMDAEKTSKKEALTSTETLTLVEKPLVVDHVAEAPESVMALRRSRVPLVTPKDSATFVHVSFTPRICQCCVRRTRC
jgi:hypothetical protein